MAGALSAALALLVSGTAGLQDANANGDTRTLDLYHEHTRESASITFRRNGQYVTEGLRQLNWILRDWRIDEQIQMDPKLFDIVWQVYRESGATGPVHVNSAYRSPQTNAALRRRSRGVAQFSQHMRGKAMDIFFENASMARVREIGVRLQRGGVGFYPHSRHQFVHLDAGGVRSWPRLPDAQLARLFPDGRTVHIPRSGRPMAGYEVAKADILSRGGTVAGYSTYAEGGPRKSLWTALFGGGGEDEDEDAGALVGRGSTRVASADSSGAASGPRGFFSFFGGGNQASEPQTVASIGTSGAAMTPEPPPVAAAPISVSPSISVPLPPRRPSSLAALVRENAGPKGVSADPPNAVAPMPPGRPERLGEARTPSRSPVAGIGTDDRAALKSLFATTVPSAGSSRRAPLPGVGDAKRRATFSSRALDAPAAGSFSGSALSRNPSR